MAPEHSKIALIVLHGDAGPAKQSLAAMKPDDAIAFAQLNIAFNANSARSYQVLSQAYQRKGDKTPAIQSLERAVELDPMNQGFKNQLQQLKSGA